MDPGRLPSTVDPDSVQTTDKGKRSAQRQVRISAWKLAKLDSNEAAKAAAKARASSSVLRPISSQHHPYDASHISSSNISGRSSPLGVDQAFHVKDSRAGTSRLSPAPSSYPPSCGSREDAESCSQSNLNSPHTSMALSPLYRQPPNQGLYNPIYQHSIDQSPWSATQSQSDVSEQQRTPVRPNTNLVGSEDTRYSVFWDPEAGRFVSSSSGNTPQVRGTELSLTGQSIFFGGPLVTRGSGEAGGSGRGSASSYVQHGRSQRVGQLPVFVPRDHQQHSSHTR